MSRPPQTEPNRARMAEEAARCFQLRTQGLSLRDITAATGLPRETVRRRIQHELDSRITPEVAEYRAIQDATLDALQAYLMDLVLNSEASDAKKFQAIDRLLRIFERRARLHGLDAPVRVTAAITQQTQTEAELEGLFAAQDARNEAIRRATEGI